MIDAATPLMQRIRHFWPVVNLCIGLLIITAIVVALDDRILARTLTEGLIRVVIVVALYMFIGNSGIMSFGHIGFMMIGAYATGWQTCCPFTREMFMPGLPGYLLDNSHHFVLAIFLAGLLSAFVALIAGIALMRLSGIAASIGTFAFLMIIYSVYLRWSTWTSGASSVIGLPQTTTPWVAYCYAVVTILAAFFYSRSKFGLALRASRDDEVAAKAAGVNVIGQRLLAFVISGFFCGMAGGLFGHFLGMLTVDTFFLNLTLITLAMLVIGGMQSLSGAVVGVVVLTVVIDLLKNLESGMFGKDGFMLPTSSTWVVVGVVMMLIIIFRRSGITRNAELYWPFKSDITRTQSKNVVVIDSIIARSARPKEVVSAREQIRIELRVDIDEGARATVESTAMVYSWRRPVPWPRTEIEIWILTWQLPRLLDNLCASLGTARFLHFK